MRTVFALVIMLGLLSLLAACPRDGGGETAPVNSATNTASAGDTATPDTAAGAPPEVADEAADESDEDPATADDSEPDAVADPALGGEAIGVVESKLEVDGIKLGIDLDKLMERYPADGNFVTSAFWVAEGETGMVGANDKLIPEVSEGAYFLNSQLVGFMKHDIVEGEIYDVDVESLTEKFGQPLSDPPAWAMDTSVFKDYAPPKAEEQIRFAFWGDEDGRTVLLASYDILAAYYMLWIFHVDLFDKAVEETNQAMATQAEAGLPGV